MVKQDYIVLHVFQYISAFAFSWGVGGCTEKENHLIEMYGLFKTAAARKAVTGVLNC